MKKLVLFFAAVLLSSLSAQAGDKFCHMQYHLMEDGEAAIFYYQVTYYEPSENAHKVINQLDCEGATKGAKFDKPAQMKQIKDECKSVTVGNITMPVETFDYNPACG